ncbi:ATP-dependent DNA helicase RecQ [Pseudoalteromonas nigrifaciens]|uniref:ATP-dependent DNA helicase RecQ n=1 Tax=Pseudoalteromonas nigrifaciens TaxID=28109 RepID=A0AAC9UNA4_9GAMM|nr:RecQ family ATP-dependent DNA helicase [Pseudoalteromonas nigrifaciens]ASM55792.1 ATP-dependent DNA helicase RecQ [Pseudoalteromonas nigrifaciens]GEN42478.1 ATP-dependent DNA helicase RecQ [Pseudoalteromonas nigrifaciens]SUD22933.1 ATP-dependent DNA helicase recQ [Pseudoalteromonas nigrifaciens]
MTPSLIQSLEQHFGFNQFRGGQQQTIEQLLNGQSSLAIFPTGSGKSLCYQLTALHLPHLTLVVSPLLALMKDQISFLNSKGIYAASLDSSQDQMQSSTVMNDVRSGKIKVLMVSVERFKNERFREFINQIAVSMLVVDEAHCISEWGHNFRPDYLKLPRYREELNIPLVLLLTATATKKVKRDMAERFAIAPECIVQTGFYRANLDLSVLSVKTADKNTELTEIVRAQTGPGIVYVTLQQSAEQVANMLSAQGLQAVAYHAGLEDTLRGQIQDDFMAGKINVVVATIAFGMGVDKSDIRFVIHYDLPKSIENYSQEIGRAGRDGQPSQCFTLANLDGLNTVENFVYGDTPELSGIEHVINDIRQHQSDHSKESQQWEMQEYSLSSDSNIRQLALKTLLVQLEMQGAITPLYAYYADFKYKFLVDKAALLGHFDADRQAFLQLIFSHTQFKKIWGTLNFDTLTQAAQVDRKRVVAALDYLAEKNLIALETKRITQVYQVHNEVINNPELAKQLHSYFVDKEQAEIKRIAALIRFFELKTCLSYNLARYFDDHQAPQQCGHCSVCRGQAVTLEYSLAHSFANDAVIYQKVDELLSHLASKGIHNIGIETQCRFLAGMSVPLFARNKVRQLSGFGLCEQQRYSEIKTKLLAR